MDIIQALVDAPFKEYLIVLFKFYSATFVISIPLLIIYFFLNLRP